jgi:hypothetical protein
MLKIGPDREPGAPTLKDIDEMRGYRVAKLINNGFKIGGVVRDPSGQLVPEDSTSQTPYTHDPNEHAYTTKKDEEITVAAHARHAQLVENHGEENVVTESPTLEIASRHGFYGFNSQLALLLFRDTLQSPAAG